MYRTSSHRISESGSCHKVSVRQIWTPGQCKTSGLTQAGCAAPIRRLFQTGSADHLYRFTKFQMGGFPRSKPSKLRLRTLIRSSVSLLRTARERSAQVHWSQLKEVICLVSKARLLQFCRRSSVSPICLSKCQPCLSCLLLLVSRHSRRFKSNIRGHCPSRVVP